MEGKVRAESLLYGAEGSERVKEENRFEKCIHPEDLIGNAGQTDSSVFSHSTLCFILYATQSCKGKGEVSL